MNKLLICAALLGGLILSVSAADIESGFISIFNGKDLSGWDGDSAHWSVKNGVIHAETTVDNPIDANTFLIWTNGITRDFVLRLDYKITGNNPQKWGNSGIQYRAKRVGDKGWVLHGYQADIDTDLTFTGILYEEGMRGILSLRGECTELAGNPKKTMKKLIPHEETTLELVSNALKSAIKQNDWNSYSVRVETLENGANRITHTVNGHLLTQVVDASGKGAAEGLLGLQLHAGPSMAVEFKNIRLKNLNDK